ncbi:MAG: hypothetical protein ABW022_17190 [Actinoplanes sp.]
MTHAIGLVLHPTKPVDESTPSSPPGCRRRSTIPPELRRRAEEVRGR